MTVFRAVPISKPNWHSFFQSGTLPVMTGLKQCQFWHSVFLDNIQFVERMMITLLLFGIIDIINDLRISKEVLICLVHLKQIRKQQQN